MQRWAHFNNAYSHYVQLASEGGVLLVVPVAAALGRETVLDHPLELVDRLSEPTEMGLERRQDERLVGAPRPVALGQDQLRARFGLTTIAIKRTSKTGHGDFTTVSPGPDDIVQPGDTLALLGSNELLGQLEKMLKPAKSSS